MSTNFYYPLGHGSKWDNNELRYSLRSLEKNVKDPVVTIVGNCPPFIKLGSVQYIPLPEPSGNRLFRVGAKLIAALPYLPDNFVYMNDDYYIMEPVDHFEPIYTGTLRQKLALEQNEGYESIHIKAESNTLEALIDSGKEPLDYDAHAPFPMCRDFVFYMGATFPFWNDMQLKCIYGNMYDIGGVQGPNAKVRTWQGWKYFSTDDHPNDDTQKLLKETFPNPSRFELC